MSTRDAADTVADVVLATPGVAGLHAGMFGEVGTYLPGRRVDGVRLGDTDIDIHVTVREGVPVRETAAAVREAVARRFPGQAVNVTVEDVIAGDAAPAD
ncbi:Asp23/Gls24 family envelope stress response protein [Mycobacterium sp. PSTR-4-N]|uniref:Asp23/Gls24 family envelope stress response protein n=1 Tax=Mycobacterium sp. PSTR-4-N TaxID=2917745 RepID=UPI001F14F768|nr:Asp23/Gls24 family envelope stress response protein [Mycobacterium sp. PSTR-4-N]MCG7596947.1 Asp23/Gls24 family envelope stress response protein [Mycobacterium sp. PSTR-4-N]